MHSDEEMLTGANAYEEQDEAPLLRSDSNATTAEQNSVASDVSTTPRNISILNYLLEPAVFLLTFGVFLSSTVFTNQILYTTCTVIFAYNTTECEPLLGIEKTTDETSSIESIVQPYAAQILMIKALLESIVPALISLFIGPWSDKFGRRPIILTAFTGSCLSAIILLILTIISANVNMSPWFFLLSTIPTVLSGGQCALITGIYCYVSDLAVNRARAKRMVILDATVGAGMGFGTVAGGYVYAATTTVTIFAISAGLILTSTIYVYLFVRESLQPAQKQPGSKMREFFDIALVKDLMRTCFKRRQNYEHLFIWSASICLILSNFVLQGEVSVTYLFLRKKFDWNVEQVSTYHAITIAASVVGCTSGIVLLLKYFKFSIFTMANLCLLCNLMQSTMRGLARNWWDMYIALALGFMSGILVPMLRAILSIFTAGTEVGKIFALTTSLEYLTALGAAPLYTAVYDATLTFYPGIFNFISAGLFLISLSFTATIYVLRRRTANL